MMEDVMMAKRNDGSITRPGMIRRQWLLMVYSVMLLVQIVAGTARADWPGIALSKDGAPIAYETYGAGDTTLLFVHGWSCDARYWRAQVPYFAKKHRVVTMDLAGHGHSGSQRGAYTMAAFGEDVRAVADATGSRRIILIGHSMGGSVIAEAARLMPGRVIGLVGVDTLSNIERRLTTQEVSGMAAPLEKDFSGGVRQFVGRMFYPESDQKLTDWVLADMAAASPTVALSALKEMMGQYITGEAAKVFDSQRTPVIAINGDLWPVDVEANRRHMTSFDAIIVKKADHFLMLNRSEEFNAALEKAVEKFTSGKPAP